MARDDTQQQQRREQSSRVESTARHDVGSTSTRTEGATQRSDRQRSIQTGRDTGRSAGVTKRPATPTIYGSAVSPFSMMRRMAEDMDRLFENFGLGSPGLGWSALDQTAWTPTVETFRRGDDLVVRAELPGLRKEDVQVEVNDGVLTISGERNEEQEENRDDYYRSERSYGRFYRALPLPDGVTGEKCDATFTDGVLEVTLPVPKQQQTAAKRIPIR